MDELTPDVYGGQALVRLLVDYPDVATVLDIGSGTGAHATLMRAAGKHVTTVSLRQPADIVGNYLEQDWPQPFDAIWASAVLEHQPDPGLFLRRCRQNLRAGGVLAVTVPPSKNAIVGGHLTLWNSGLLLYQMIVAGFDCRAARVSGLYDSYSLSVIVRNEAADLPPLAYDTGDIEALARFFPLPVVHGFDGRLPAVRW
jgi:SAM-dependent methyltransferase